jgi:hydrogenase maturation protease
LVAGIGNIFLGDDGFGGAVARRLLTVCLPASVRVFDFGIRGIHLAYELLDGNYSDVILVDAVSRGEPAGTVCLLDLGDGHATIESSIIPDAHAMNPDAVIALIRSMVETPPKLWLIGCEPERIEEAMGLSESVRRAVDVAAGMVQSLAEKLCGGGGAHSSIDGGQTHHA